jgi:hypothetical protein
MGFYSREIKFYKSLKLIDSDGDGVKDKIVYQPLTNWYYLPIGINQDIKDIGNYQEGLNQDFELVDFNGVWDESNDGSGDGFQGGGGGDLNDPSGGESGTDPFAETEFCNDPEAINYNASLVGVSGFVPCPNNGCCNYTEPTDYNGSANQEDIVNQCLAIYTDWGPWNDELLLNDTNQIYVVKTDCTLTFRLINQLSQEGNQLGPIPGGWYGASIKIEVDYGNGYETITPSHPVVSSINNDINFNTNLMTFTLGEKVRIWKAQDVLGLNFFTTKPYRDLKIKPGSGSSIKVTYYNNSILTNNTNYNNYAKYLRLQLIKGTESTPTPTPPTPSNGDFSWAQDLPGIDTFLGLPANRVTEGETFHYLSDNFSTSNTLKSQVWIRYLNGDDNPTTIVPWGPSNSDIETGTFYTNPDVVINYDFGDSINENIIYNSSDPNLDYFSNPSEELVNFNFLCVVNTNWVSYFDKNGDGFIEYDTNYPTLGIQNQGSVDEGLFSKTRYDSPYIYLKPGTKDGALPLNDNVLTSTSVNQSDVPTGPVSLAGWRKYAYVDYLGGLGGSVNYQFANTSPTCQLGGCDNVYNSDINLTDPDNYNIFLPQADDNPTTSCANFGTGVTVNHIWNYGTTDARGGCCAKKYDPSLVFSLNGPYLDSDCSRCHNQLTTRSAQPVLDNNIKIAMQTTDSDIYYGPFYDPQNPTYNGYGLAFSKANKFCRDVRGKNGVEIYNSAQGTNGTNLYIGGILHGGAIQQSPNTIFEERYGVESSPLNFQIPGVNDSNSACSPTVRLPLKCSKVSNDPNCPSGTCFKCLYCFNCSQESIEEGVFTGDNGGQGGQGGVDELGGDFNLIDSFGQIIQSGIITINSGECSTGPILPENERSFSIEVLNTPVTITVDLYGGGGGSPDCVPPGPSELGVNVLLNDGQGGPINNTIVNESIPIGGSNPYQTITYTLNNTGLYNGLIQLIPYYRTSFEVTLTVT